MIQVVDLFSCVGCHALGLSYASDAFETIAFCESRPYRSAVLSRRFPGVRIHPDVRTLDAASIEHDSSLPVVVFGGPPCQTTSKISAISGSRTGESLVGEQIRIASGLEADWTIVEQPTGNPLWEAQTGELLRRAGYRVGRAEFSAADVGAPYLRRRVYLLACADLRGLEVAIAALPSAVRSVADRAHSRHTWDEDDLAAVRVDAESTPRLDRSLGPIVRLRGDQYRVDRIEALGDSNPPEMAEVIGRCIASVYGLEKHDD